ncbi:hypothetical protein OCH7691_04117 [Oceanibacterium hippocampi]|uniref:Lipoprotein n=1 Tax=Oceanibacterium hippocampi TaxID=745714 RepID=A0A1Y5TXS2_9PROT|nr:hypothetical protein OCH7691_04117 [Oceanibacterium hippocampi]
MLKACLTAVALAVSLASLSACNPDAGRGVVTEVHTCSAGGFMSTRLCRVSVKLDDGTRVRVTAEAPVASGDRIRLYGARRNRGVVL